MARKPTYKELEKRVLELEQDESNRKMAEEALRSSEELFHEIFEISPIGIVLGIAETQTFLKANPYGCSILGYSEAELRQLTVQDITHPEDWIQEQKMVQAVLNEGSPSFTMEKRMVRKDGETRWFRVTATTFQSKIEGFRAIAFIQDITDHKQSEAMNKKLKARIHQMKKAESLGCMAGAIAHLFNNQLNVIMGNLELSLNELSGNRAIHGKLINAMQAANRSAEISGLMLTYLGQSIAKMELLDISSVCRKNLRSIRQTIPEHVGFKADIPQSGPVVRANENQFKQVLTDLITNGWESIGDNTGRVALAIRTIPASKIQKSQLISIDWNPTAPTFSCMEVTDTGCGMSEEEIEKIFDPFYTTKFPGRGLGLSAIQGIVKSWGGTIMVESKKDRGSVFRVLLPIVTDEVLRQSEKGKSASASDLRR